MCNKHHGAKSDQNTPNLIILFLLQIHLNYANICRGGVGDHEFFFTGARGTTAGFSYGLGSTQTHHFVPAGRKIILEKIFVFFYCGIKTQKKIQTKWNKIERVGEICGNWHLWPNQPVMAFNATHKVPYHIFRPVGTPNPVDMGLWGDLSEEGKVYKVPPVHFLGCVMVFRFGRT